MEFWEILENSGILGNFTEFLENLEQILGIFSGFKEFSWNLGKFQRIQEFGEIHRIFREFGANVGNFLGDLGIFWNFGTF